VQLLDGYYQALARIIKIQKEQFKNAVFNLDRISKEVEIGKQTQKHLHDVQLEFCARKKNEFRNTTIISYSKKYNCSNL
jgi:outer membrane protein